jgi:aspartate/methionine/tyrosine aminotransferase
MYSRRIGWCIVPDELVTPMTVIQHHTLLTADPICQFGAVKALDFQDEVEYIRTLYKRRRDYTMEQFQNVKNVRALPSQGSFYHTLDCEKFMKEKGITSSLDLAVQIMKKTYVATVPGSDFGLPYTLRLSFSCQRYNEGIDRLVDFFNS